MPLWMPAGVVTSKSSSVPLGVGEGFSGVPWMAGFTPACPAGRIVFWMSGLVWLVGRMAPENKGWKRRPVKICGATGWNEGRKQKTELKDYILKASQAVFLLGWQISLGRNGRMEKAKSEKIIKMGPPQRKCLSP